MMGGNMMGGNGSMGTAMGGAMGMGDHKMMGHNMMGMNPVSNNSNMDGMTMNMKNNGTGCHMMMMMQMYFTLGESVTILFKQWKTNNLGELLASCFALFVLSVLYEGLKVGRQVLLSRAEEVSADVYANEGSGLATDNVVIVRPVKRQLCSLAHLIQTILHMIQVFLGYLLMLAFMTYNAWICIAVVLGSGLGYFLFGWKTATLVSSGDHCN